MRRYGTSQLFGLRCSKTALALSPEACEALGNVPFEQSGPASTISRLSREMWVPSRGSRRIWFRPGRCLGLS